MFELAHSKPQNKQSFLCSGADITRLCEPKQYLKNQFFWITLGSGTGTRNWLQIRTRHRTLSQQVKSSGEIDAFFERFKTIITFIHPESQENSNFNLSLVEIPSRSPPLPFKVCEKIECALSFGCRPGTKTYHSGCFELSRTITPQHGSLRSFRRKVWSQYTRNPSHVLFWTLNGWSEILTTVQQYIASDRAVVPAAHNSLLTRRYYPSNDIGHLQTWASRRSCLHWPQLKTSFESILLFPFEARLLLNTYNHFNHILWHFHLLCLYKINIFWTNCSTLGHSARFFFSIIVWFHILRSCPHSSSLLPMQYGRP